MTTTALAGYPITAKTLAKQDISLADVVRSIQLDAAAQQPNRVTAPLPKKISPTDLQRARADSLLELINEIKLPAVRRKLTAREKADLLRWTQHAKDVGKLVETIIEQLKTTFFNHADVLAEEKGRAVPHETPRDKHGWYLLDDIDDAGVVEGEPMKLTREHRQGQIALPLESIDELVAAKVLSAEDRKRCVRTVEVVDEGAVMEILGERPHLIPEVVQYAKQVSSSSVSFQLRQNK